MARSYGSFILNRIEEIPDLGIAYIYANNSNAKAIINLDKGLLEHLRKRTWTHNQILNYFWDSLHKEYLHSAVIAYFLGDTDMVKGREILKTYIDKGYQVDHFQNNNRSESGARMDCRIENLHLVEQGQNKANYSTFYYLPYEFHSVMHKGCFSSYMTDGAYEVYKVYNNFSEYLSDRNYFYSNGLFELLQENIKHFEELPKNEHRNNQLAAVKQIILNGNAKAETNHKISLRLLEKYNITLEENETRILPDGYVVSNVNEIVPSKLREVQSNFVIINENPEIRKKLIQNIENMFFSEASSS